MHQENRLLVANDNRYRPDHVNHVIGTGVASVALDNGVPIASRTSDYWWNADAGEPFYGDVTAYTYGPYIWALGHGGPDGLSAYLTRVDKSSWNDVSAYEYYNGETDTWQKERLYHPSSAMAVQGLWGIDQGQMFWSAYYQKHMLIYMLKWPDSSGKFQVWGALADRPRGPWTTGALLFEVAAETALDLVYCSIAQTQYDPSHKTVVVTVCNGSVKIQAFKVTFA